VLVPPFVDLQTYVAAVLFVELADVAVATATVFDKEQLHIVDVTQQLGQPQPPRPVVVVVIAEAVVAVRYA